MSSVTIRKRVLKNGRMSLFLDIYHQGKTKHKSLSLFLEKGTSKKVKELNNQILLVAEEIMKT